MPKSNISGCGVTLKKKISWICMLKMSSKIFFRVALEPEILLFAILTLIPISFFPTYSLYHALVTRYLNNMNHSVTIFLAWGSSDSVAKRITRQTSDREDCSSNPPGGECIYSNVKKLGLSGIRTRISCVEARCPNHITNA